MMDEHDESTSTVFEAKVGGIYFPIHNLCSLEELIYISAFTPMRILRNGPATIVFWPDGTKTVVKRAPDEPDNEYVAFTAALALKIFGSNSALKRIIAEKTEEQK